jgi:predicted nicotinamide N-methyase
VTVPAARRIGDARSRNRASFDTEAAAAFIAANLPLSPAPSLPNIQIHAARPDSGLRRLVGAGRPPFWAYAWAGGIALARHLFEQPQTVAGRRVLDFGAGSGLVAIAAALAGARSVAAAEIDPHARAAIALNAAANGVEVLVLDDDTDADGPPPSGVDLVLAGDVFYDARTARRSLRVLDRCLDAGIAVLVGDPGRPDLPVGRLAQLARYAGVVDVGAGAALGGAAVFALRPDPAARARSNLERAGISG